MEVATFRWVQWRGHFTGQNYLFLFSVWVGRQGRRHERLGVGMQRIVEKLLNRRQLDHLTQIHDRHPVAHIPHRSQVVGYEHVADVVFRLQVLQQVHDLGPDRHVQRRYRLIQYDYLGIQRKRPGDGQTLPLSSAKLVGI